MQLPLLIEKVCKPEYNYGVLPLSHQGSRLTVNFRERVQLEIPLHRPCILRFRSVLQAIGLQLCVSPSLLDTLQVALIFKFSVKSTFVLIVGDGLYYEEVVLDLSVINNAALFRYAASRAGQVSGLQFENATLLESALL